MQVILEQIFHSGDDSKFPTKLVNTYFTYVDTRSLGIMYKFIIL